MSDNEKKPVEEKKSSSNKPKPKQVESKINVSAACGLFGLNNNDIFAVRKRFSNSEKKTASEWSKILSKILRKKIK